MKNYFCALESRARVECTFLMHPIASSELESNYSESALGHNPVEIENSLVCTRRESNNQRQSWELERIQLTAKICKQDAEAWIQSQMPQGRNIILVTKFYRVSRFFSQFLYGAENCLLFPQCDAFQLTWRCVFKKSAQELLLSKCSRVIRASCSQTHRTLCVREKGGVAIFTLKPRYSHQAIT